MSKKLPPPGLLDALRELSRPELAELWQAAHGCPPPKGVKRPLLEHSAAWRQQARRLGGLVPDARRRLASLVAAKSGGGTTVRAASDVVAGEEGVTGLVGDAPRQPVVRRQLHPGDRLVREWNGRSHLVEVVEDGFVFDGRKWKSLSAIARRITGAHWSGPRFFGL